MSAVGGTVSPGALLHAEAARIAVGGATMIESLDLQTRGDRVVVLGDAESLLAALCGAPRGAAVGESDDLARVVGGSLRVLGRDVASGAHREVTGFAPLDPPLPGSWSVEEYLGWGLRLGGVPRRRAGALAVAALERLELADLRRVQLRRLSPVLRRGVMLALAIVHEPAAIVIESPLEHLDESATAQMMVLLGRATEGRAVLLWLHRLVGMHSAIELARVASDVAVLRDGVLVAHAEPASLFSGARLFELTIFSGADALRTTLAEQGMQLVGGPKHFSVELPSGMGASTILTAAAKARAAVVACMPVL
jgi:ABC-type cobalamin/Fe3+-siderophores transport system ATPase subunit